MKKFTSPELNQQTDLLNTYPYAFILSVVLIFSLLFIASEKGIAQTYPTGFGQTQVASGLTNPTCMAFAPDGRLFVCQQAGSVRVVKNGALLTQPFMSISVASSGER